MFRTEVSIIIIIAEENSAKDLLKHKTIWELKLNLTQIKENKKWHKIILYELLTNIFQSKEDLKIRDNKLIPFFLFYFFLFLHLVYAV